MPSVISHFATIDVDLNTGPDIRDITDDLNHSFFRWLFVKGLLSISYLTHLLYDMVAFRCRITCGGEPLSSPR